MSSEANSLAGLKPKQLAILQLAVLVVALCGIAYELIIATVSSYLLGNSVYQFSITIGLFMFAMGVGSYVTRAFDAELVSKFITIEILVSLIGGLSSTLLFVVFPWTVFFQPTQYTLIIIIGALVGAEIPILTRVLSESEDLRDSIAKVLSLDYLGALIGSVSFPLLLLPKLGLFRSSFVIGLLNIGVAIFTIFLFWKTLKRPKLLLTVSVLLTVALIGGMFGGSAINAYAEGQLFAEHIIHREQTPYQRIIVTKDEHTERIRLFLDGHLQFAEVDEYRYHEALVHPVMSIDGPKDNVLILGGGDGLAIREVLKYGDQVKQIDLVDIDPAMTRLCHDFPPIRKLNKGGLKNPKVKIHHTDAFTFVKNRRATYDRVIIDLPDPHNEALNKLYSVEMYKMVKRAMKPVAHMVSQSSSPFFTREAFWQIGHTVAAAGLDVFSYHITVPSFSIWGFTLASSGMPVPRKFDLGTIEMRYLTAELMNSAGVFPKDSGRVKVAVNSIFEPTLYENYIRGVMRY